MADIEISDPFGEIVSFISNPTFNYDHCPNITIGYIDNPTEKEKVIPEPTCPPAMWGNMKRKHKKGNKR